MMKETELIEALGAHLIDRRGGRDAYRAVANDSRTLQPGDLFFAIETEKRDGHAFVADAVGRGAAGVVVAREVETPPDVAVYRVHDTRAALAALAAWWRSRFPVQVIGVTGSVGKTTTKELVATLLSERHHVLKSPANFNDDVGLSMTLFMLEPGHDRAVVEMGMYALGEIRGLCAIARPAVGVVTNVGPSHLERLGTLDAIARAKSELVEALPPDGLAVLNADDPAVLAMRARTTARVLTYGLGEADVRGSEVEGRGLDGVEFAIAYQGRRERVRSPIPGRQVVHNALAAATVALADGIPLRDVAAALSQATIPGRVQLHPGRAGSLIIDDTYNASPASVLAALDLLSELPGRHVAVLGDMRELGSATIEGHRDVGRRAAEVADVVVTIGELGKLIAEAAREAGHPCVQAFDTKEEAARDLAPRLQQGDCVLLKASRALALETMVHELGA